MGVINCENQLYRTTSVRARCPPTVVVVYLEPAGDVDVTKKSRDDMGWPSVLCKLIYKWDHKLVWIFWLFVGSRYYLPVCCWDMCWLYRSYNPWYHWPSRVNLLPAPAIVDGSASSPRLSRLGDAWMNLGEPTPGCRQLHLDMTM